MAASPTPDEVTELWIHPGLRAVAGGLAGMIAWILAEIVPGSHGWLPPAVGAAAIAAVVLLAGASRIELTPDALSVRTAGAPLRREVISWRDVQTIEIDPSFGTFGARTVIRSAGGNWRVPYFLAARGGLAYAGVPRQRDVLWSSWIAAGGGTMPPPPTRPWGPEPSALNTVVLRPQGVERWILPRTSRLLGAGIAMLIIGASIGQWTYVLAGAAAVLGCLILAARQEVVLTSDGLVVRRLGTAVLPWSSVQAVTTGAPRRHAVGVRLLTAVGPVDLPAPIAGVDPAFDRKLDFIARCWAAHRGAAWTAPAPPPPASPGAST